MSDKHPSSVSPYLLRPLRSLDEVQRDLEQANAVTTQARTIHDRLVAALTALGESDEDTVQRLIHRYRGQPLS
jgi:hypothetical protein